MDMNIWNIITLPLSFLIGILTFWGLSKIYRRSIPKSKKVEAEKQSSTLEIPMENDNQRSKEKLTAENKVPHQIIDGRKNRWKDKKTKAIYYFASLKVPFPQIDTTPLPKELKTFTDEELQAEIISRSGSDIGLPIKVNCFRCPKGFWIKWNRATGYSKAYNWGYYTEKETDRGKYICFPCLQDLYLNQRPKLYEWVKSLQKRHHLSSCISRERVLKLWK